MRILCWTFVYTLFQKNQATFIFMNNYVKHWPILIILGKQHLKNKT